MARMPVHYEHLLTPGEVAALAGVTPKTVSTWARRGQIDAVRTLGGHRRFTEKAVRELLANRRSERAR